MKKTVLLVLLITSICSLWLSSHNNNAQSNIIYLHEQIKRSGSSQEHLQTFSTSGLVVIDFYADWCPPCRRMSPLIDNAAAIMHNITFIKINRDFFLDLAKDFNITSIPTLIFLHNGKEIGRYDGGPLTDQKIQQLILSKFQNYQ